MFAVAFRRFLPAVEMTMRVNVSRVNDRSGYRPVDNACAV